MDKKISGGERQVRRTPTMPCMARQSAKAGKFF